MGDWDTEIKATAELMRNKNTVRLLLPLRFTFTDHGTFDFDRALAFFDWGISNKPVVIDLSKCKSANYQTLSLLVLYVWRLKSSGCRVEILGAGKDAVDGAGKMWRAMGAPGLHAVAANENQNFRGSRRKPLFAIRNHDDFREAIGRANDYAVGFNIEYINTLRYVIGELLYNTMEHGWAFYERSEGVGRRIPSIIQFTWYQNRDEIQFLVGDVGMGVRKHLSQSYPDLPDDEAALRKAIEPQVSGTFNSASDPYRAQNNAGMGLFLSTNIIRRLSSDMHLISGDAVLHVSPADVTTRQLKQPWPGTIALVTVRLEKNSAFALQPLMAEFRAAASREVAEKDEAEKENTYYISIVNYFGIYPEDKSEAIKFRDNRVLPAVEQRRKLLLDFEGVRSSPHSFLNALLATPIKRMGMQAFRRIKIINAAPDVRETIDFILQDNTKDFGD